MSLVRLFDTLALDSWRNPFSIFGTAVAADAWLASDTSAFANTYIESRDTAGAYVFSAALPPGVKKEEMTVEVDEGNVLVITGERSVRREERSDRLHHIERSCATFLGRFHLPGDAAVDGVKAAMDAGVLTVTVPKVGAPVTAAIAAEKPAEAQTTVAVEAGGLC
ncbi:17.9 kDa heat shock protein 2 [Dichanthelium oligosanthes]|uniref:17.9 kDa heat shock protein 2 n=1 Tax=Dichanthelium oligosanthes TaxID=888268 RepID=A0A1E5UTW3_9POAL|nr:17.9 kDa heat shock protein 2 [Dichanthelium oligosanthes]